MGLASRISSLFSAHFRAAPGAESGPANSDVGKRPDTRIGNTIPVDDVRRYYLDLMQIPAERQGVVRLIRQLNRSDPRVASLHRRTSSYIAKGGLKLIGVGQFNSSIHREWDRFLTATDLRNRARLENYANGFLVEGNLALQWLISDPRSPVVSGCLRMPSETIVPLADKTGKIADPKKAYKQVEWPYGQDVAEFAAWQLSLSRLDPDNYDDHGSMGAPYIIAGIPALQGLREMEPSMVPRRVTRAAQRMVHVLEGAGELELAEYQAKVEANARHGAYKDYYLNKKGTVTAVTGDATLADIADIEWMTRVFFSAAPGGMELFGFPGNVSRETLAEIKEALYEVIDGLQDRITTSFLHGFRLHLLLQGIDPDELGMQVAFAERMTQTPTQRVDRAMKLQSLGASEQTVFEAAGLDPVEEARRKVEERARMRRVDDEDFGEEIDLPAEEDDPEHPDAGGRTQRRVQIVEGNGGGGESATTISN